MEEYSLLFEGRYKNTLDAKGRLNIPATFRKKPDGSEIENLEFIITQGTIDLNVILFPIREWRRMMDELELKIHDGEKLRRLVRRLNYYASRQKVDKQGRINIPEDLIRYAKLDKEVEVIGANRKIEVWNPKMVIPDFESVNLKEDPVIPKFLKF
jgi:MraZ protein